MSTEPNKPLRKWWVAHARGADFTQLKAKGFLTFYPMCDDYVFLEATENNNRLTEQQELLRIKFIRSTGRTRGPHGNLQTVTEKELEGLAGQTTDKIGEGTPITVVEGYCEHLDGTVLYREGDSISVELRGCRRRFRAELYVNQVVLREEQQKEPVSKEEFLQGATKEEA